MKIIQILFLFVMMSCSIKPPSYTPENRPNSDSLYLSNSLVLYFQNESKQVFFPDELLTFDYDTVLIDDFLNSEKKIFLFISKTSCLACCYHQVELLYKTLKSNNDTQAVIIADFKPNRDFYVFWKDNNIEIPLLYIDNYTQYFPKTESNQPYYFVSDKNKRIELFFSPVEGNDKITKVYLSYAIEYIKSQKQQC